MPAGMAVSRAGNLFTNGWVRCDRRDRPGRGRLTSIWLKSHLFVLAMLGSAASAGAAGVGPSDFQEVMAGDPGVGFVILVVGCLTVLAWLFVMCRLQARRQRQEHVRREDFSVRLIRSQEQERQRIAHELHDSLGQDLLLIKTSAQLALDELEGAPKVRKRLNAITSLAAKSVQDVRAITGDLRPPELDRLGLAAAVVRSKQNINFSQPSLQKNCKILC